MAICTHRLRCEKTISPPLCKAKPKTTKEKYFALWIYKGGMLKKMSTRTETKVTRLVIPRSSQTQLADMTLVEVEGYFTVEV